jgi:hypothetical protein
MKNLIRVSLMKSVGIAITEPGRLQCKLLSAKTAESPKPSMANTVDYFTRQGRESFISVASGMPVARAVIHSYCSKFTQILHRVKPFKIAPKLSKIAA